MSNLDDTDEFAMRGKLGSCSDGVKRLFRDLDHCLRARDSDVSTRPLHRADEWLARSYHASGRSFCEIHPKMDYIMLKVPEADFAFAPENLVATGTRKNWLRISPSNKEEALQYLEKIRP